LNRFVLIFNALYYILLIYQVILSSKRGQSPKIPAAGAGGAGRQKTLVNLAMQPLTGFVLANQSFCHLKAMRLYHVSLAGQLFLRR